ncbi:hypothetical protein E2C01_014054 [Portunus trituberculatus]|uniref:Uncharacterized protein n=1 Tax=Portunus trituberculatus TaxID=210409 RepID=A0A5B7DHT6_PORTR|nr:hypothetical protein [Portunus trituberculatus]
MSVYRQTSMTQDEGVSQLDRRLANDVYLPRAAASEVTLPGAPRRPSNTQLDKQNSQRRRRASGRPHTVWPWPCLALTHLRRSAERGFKLTCTHEEGREVLRGGESRTLTAATFPVQVLHGSSNLRLIIQTSIARRLARWQELDVYQVAYLQDTYETRVGLRMCRCQLRTGQDAKP